MKSLHVIVIIIKAHLKIDNCNIEEFEDAKGVIKIRKSKKDKTEDWLQPRTKRQITIYKTKDRVTQTSLKTGGEPM